MILMWHRPLNNIITQNFFCLLTKRYLWKYTNFKLPRNVWNLWTELWIAWHWFLNLSFNAIFSDMLTLLLKLQYWFLAIRGHGNDFHCESFARWSCSNCYSNCLVPVRRFPRPSRSMHFGDVSEANKQETPHFFVRTTWPDTLAARNNLAINIIIVQYL